MPGSGFAAQGRACTVVLTGCSVGGTDFTVTPRWPGIREVRVTATPWCNVVQGFGIYADEVGEVGLSCSPHSRTPDDVSQEGPEDTALHTQRRKIHMRTIQTSLKSVLELGPGQRRRYCFGSGLPDPDGSGRQSPRKARLVGEQARPEWSSEPRG